MKIALIGYGKMGQRIEALSPEHGAEIKLILDRENNEHGKGITEEAFSDVDVAIDFSHPGAFIQNLERLLGTGTPLVIGTTGWLEKAGKVEEACKKSNVPWLYGSNFSLGVQLFGRLIRRAGELFGNSELFDAVLHEVHHTQKADAPSGTALTLSDLWKQGARSGREIKYGIPEKGRVDEEAFYVTSQRLGSVYGEHQLRINSLFDDIEITHRARSRDAFAAGALKAARWIVNQEPGFYRVEEVVEELV